ncbi:sporulation protein [Bacillus coahuilensis m2-6]|uniref:germination protein YpeB n=1 Tax=Bacillus coahuilensis TaxID=408580 RepID=UPI0007505F90|nr:germination protein YpeB [Bacillus coahuilensis]KUP07796.1 sporulation protein [Bacillus coahuilensis m2-6]
MIRGILIGVLSLGVIGTAYWGYQEHQEKNAILINAENNYQRAFHDLTYEIDLLNDKIGTTLAMNSDKSLSPALAEVWRITSEAHNDVGQLPLTLLPFNKTEEFLAKIGDFSYRTAVRNLNDNPLSDEEFATLETLYEQSGEIQNELRNVQHLVIENNLRWMDVELALATNKEPVDNTIIDGFKTVEKNVEGYEETNVNNTSFLTIQKKINNLENLKGNKITENEAKKIAKKYTGENDVNKMRVTKNGDGAKYPFYSVSMILNDGAEASMDITEVGGYPIWYINTREIKEQQISLNEGIENAKKFLKERDFENLELFESAQFENTGVLSFVTVIDGIRIYPNSIKMKVALDNGQVIGFTGDDYLRNNKERTVAKPVLSKEEAKEYINKKVEIMEDRLAVIVNDLNEEVLCFEFLGVLGNDTYRIFINSESGIEEKVEKLQNAEPIYNDVL